MNGANLPMTAHLAPLAEQADYDLTDFAMWEQALNDMFVHAFDNGPAFDEAKARFDALDIKVSKQGENMMKHTNSQPYRPHYESAPYRQSPGRREAIHGRIQGLPNTDRTAPLFITIGLLVAAYFIISLLWSL